jgi:predicted MPP superfamily phosphohydrolase
MSIGVRAGSARLFYRHFFRLLVAAASAAQWAVVAWVLSVGFGRSLPWWAHGLAVAGLYAGNRALTARPAARRGWPFRAYTATAFVALFCGLFLLATTVVFDSAAVVLGALSAEALTAGGAATLGGGLDEVFRWVASGGMAAIALTMGYGYVFGHRELRVTRIPLALAGFAAAGRSLRIAQISDIHVGQNLTLAELRAFVARVNATEPDLICVTGDIADSPLADTAGFFPALGELRARYGVCAILGNHDHFAGADRIVAELRRWTTFHVLRDSAVTLALGAVRVHVLGLDDRGRDWARGVRSDHRLAELLAAAPPDTPVLLLAHRPDIFHQAAAAAVPLTLSGHTHGGQLAVPWGRGRRRNLAEFVTPFARGLYRRGDSYLYVNCGLGVTGQRIRLFTPREISLFELTAP